MIVEVYIFALQVDKPANWELIHFLERNYCECSIVRNCWDHASHCSRSWPLTMLLRYNIHKIWLCKLTILESSLSWDLRFVVSRSNLLAIFLASLRRLSLSVPNWRKVCLYRFSCSYSALVSDTITNVKSKWWKWTNTVAGVALCELHIALGTPLTNLVPSNMQGEPGLSEYRWQHTVLRI